MKTPAQTNPFRCFTGAAYAGTLFVLLFAASVAEDQACLSARMANAACSVVPAAYYWAGGLFAAALLAWSGYCWWRDFVLGKLESDMHREHRELGAEPTRPSNPIEPTRAPAGVQDSRLA